MPLLQTEVPDLEEALVRKINQIIKESGWQIASEKYPPKPSGLSKVIASPNPNQVKRFSFTYNTPMGQVKAEVKGRVNTVEFELTGPMGSREKRFKVTRYAYLDKQTLEVRFKNKEDLVGEVQLMMIYFAPVSNLRLTPRQLEKIKYERMTNPMAPPPIGLPKQMLDYIMKMPSGPVPPGMMPPMGMGMQPMMPQVDPLTGMPYPPGMMQQQQMQLPGMPGMQPQQQMQPQMQQPQVQQQQPQQQQPQEPPKPKLTECPQCGSPLGDPQPDGTYKCEFCGAIIEP